MSTPHWFILLIVFMGGFGVGGAVCGILSDQQFRHEAIKHGYAEYSPQTGLWQWKERR